MTTFREIQSTPPSERHRFGKPVLTVRWWDEDGVRTLSKQSWFTKLRRDLNEAGKITLNLGVWKYEQGGTSEVLSEAEASRLVGQLFLKTSAADAATFASVTKSCVASDVFESRFVMLEGELFASIGERKAVELMLLHAADFLGIDAKPRAQTRQLKGDALARCKAAAHSLFELSGGDDEVIGAWLREPSNLQKEYLRGREMVNLALDTAGDRSACMSVVCPPAAIAALPYTGPFGARVLGWIERGSGPQLYIRAVAIADLFYFKD